MDRLAQRLEAELHLQRVRDAPGQHFAAEPVHDCHQVEEPFAHWNVGAVAAPDLSRLILAGQRLAGVILLPYLVWRAGYGGQITIAGDGFGKIGA